MPKNSPYRHGKRTVRFLEAVGKQAEINPALPHILVPKVGTVVEVSAELAWVLAEKGRVVIVPDKAEAPESQADRRVSQEEGFVGTSADRRGTQDDRRVSQEEGIVGSVNDRRGVPQIEGEGDHPAQADSEPGSGGPLSWFRRRDASTPEVPEAVSPAAPEVAPEPESLEAPEEPEGDQPDAAAESDDADEGPNDPLS